MSDIIRILHILNHSLPLHSGYTFRTAAILREQQLTRTRRLMETLIGQLTEPFHFEKIRARDVWHLTSRIARKVLAHTLGIFINRQVGRSDLPFEGLIA